jgi:anti-anti-sigma factor
MQVITKKEDNGVLVICLNGRLDANTSAGVEKQINDFINAGEARLIINFKGVDYISSAGLRVLVVTIKLLQGRNGKLVLSDLNERIYDVLKICGFTAIFNIKQSVSEALEEFA